METPRTWMWFKRKPPCKMHVLQPIRGTHHRLRRPWTIRLSLQQRWTGRIWKSLHRRWRTSNNDRGKAAVEGCHRVRDQASSIIPMYQLVRAAAQLLRQAVPSGHVGRVQCVLTTPRVEGKGVQMSKHKNHERDGQQPKSTGRGHLGLGQNDTEIVEWDCRSGY